MRVVTADAVVMRTVYLVSCVSAKRPDPVPAQDLYHSPWFQKARAYVTGQMRTGNEWFILSAKHHLVAPDTVIAPYELTLNAMAQPARRQWAATVMEALTPRLQDGDRVVFLAGARYREYLEKEVAALRCTVSVPMAGLRIGRQLQWLTNAMIGDRA